MGTRDAKGRRTRSKSGAVELPAPADIDAHRFRLGTEEFVVLSFPLPPDPNALAPGLTASEREIYALVVEGRSNAEIAGVRGTSPRTIANQIAGIYRKLGVGSRRELRAKSPRAERSA